MSSPLPGTARPGPLLPAGNPRIVGIVNITPDSFSDGGRYLDPAAAVAHARSLLADGADIIELGPAASHPDSAPVSVAEERRRLAPVLRRLAADGIDARGTALGGDGNAGAQDQTAERHRHGTGILHGRLPAKDGTN